MQFSVILFFILINSIVRFAWGQNQKYCDWSLCHGRPNIGCPGNAKSQCPSDAVDIKMTSKMKFLILRLHNLDRNSLASGHIPGLPSARAMPTLVNF